MTKAGDGERSAMLGYVPQYKIAADLIYDKLLDGTLEWIKVADPEAKTLDDIQIASEGTLKAYQVKWSEFSNTISYADFIRDDTKKKSGTIKPSLFKQLVEGWVQFKEKYPERNIQVYLLHKGISSTNTKAKLPIKKPNPKHPHFQSFLKDCWYDRTWCEKGLDSAPANWRSVLKDLQKISNLNDAKFLSFVSCCQLSFNYQRPTQKSIEQKEDIDKIYTLLTEMAGGEQQIIKLTKDEILQELGWLSHFNYKFNHEFPVHKVYQPITQTVKEITTCLEKMNQGYIALIGSPGSGKSTTLTQTLKYKTGFRLVRYYAYVPDNTAQGRGEANAFLHDITLSLNKRGFRDNTKRAKSREEYLILFANQLQQASKTWSKDKIVTLIMIDGLDHIQREQNPQRSLLADLPHPNTIPDGVVFILGTQTLVLDDLSAPIKTHLQNNNRIINISSLNIRNVYSIIDQWANLKSLKDRDKETIYTKSAGHPLSLAYILQLINENSHNDIYQTLNGISIYKGNIEESYTIYWDEIEKNQDLVDLLALLSRLRISINLEDIQHWSERPTVKLFISKFAHYFNKESKTCWYFFHNSFRQFILDKTGRNLFDQHDEKINSDYHKKLADFCLKSERDSPFYWQRIYHLFYSKNWQEVIQLGQQDYFRSQFFKLRHFGNIIDDITLVLLSAKETLEPLPIVRCLLMEVELNSRAEILEQIEILPLLFETKGIGAVLNYIFDGHELNVDKMEVLDFAKILIEKGYKLEAERIFDSVEPLNYFSKSKGINSNYNSDILKKWYNIAYHFMSLKDVIKIIFQTRNVKQDEMRNRDNDDSNLHYALIDGLIGNICQSQNKQQIEALFLILKTQNIDNQHLINFCFYLYKKESLILVKERLDIILNWTKNNEVNDSEKILIAEMLYKVNADSEGAKHWLKGIKQPKLYQNNYVIEANNLGSFADRIRLNRLWSALDMEVEPIIAVPNIDDKKYQGTVLFERGLVKFSHIWGKAWKQERIPREIIIQAIKPSFNLFLKNYDETQKWGNWIQLQNKAVDYYQFIINAVSQHGMEAILALTEAFKIDWQKHEWQTGWRREIILALHLKGVPKADLINLLIQVEKQINGFHDDVETRTIEYANLIITWAKLGENKRAEMLLPKVFTESFGITYHKDRQFSDWVLWLGKFAKQYPEQALNDIQHFAAALVNLEISYRGRGSQEAAQDLVSITTRLNSRYGLELTQWLFNKKGLLYTSGLTGLLLGLLDKENPPCKAIIVITQKLLIPFKEYHITDLAEKLTHSCYKFCSKVDAEALIERLSQSIETNALPSNRHDWWKGISLGLKKAGQVPSKYTDLVIKTQKTEQATNRHTITSETVHKFSFTEIQLKINSVDDLFKVLKTIKSVEYFQWLDLIKPYLHLMSVIQLNELYQLIQPLGSQYTSISAIASQLIDKDDKNSADIILNHLFESSKVRDMQWGSTSQLIFEVLVKIEPKKWRAKAIQALIDDYIGEHRYPASLIYSLDQITGIIFENSDLKLIWSEINQHVYQLNDFMDIKQLPSYSIIKNKENIEDVEPLITFSFIMLDTLIPEISELAHQAIIELADEPVNKIIIAKEIKTRLKEIGLKQIKILALLQVLAQTDLDFVVQFKADILLRCHSKHFIIRQMALMLTKKLNLVPNPQKYIALPFIYQMDFPEFQMKETSVFPLIAIGKTLLDTNDPIELIKPYKEHAERISELSGIPIENIINRTVNLMFLLVPKEQWDKAAEQSYQDWMKGIDLKIKYYRLRPQIVKLALSYVVCELLDANYINQNNIELLGSFFSCTDNKILSIIPSKRPSFIKIKRTRKQDILLKSTESVESINTVLPLFQTIDNKGHTILGELTKWRWLNRDTLTETRISMICHPQWGEQKQFSFIFEFFPSQIDWISTQYPFIKIEEPSLVIYGSNSYIDHGSIGWLAFNPKIALQLGWSLSSKGLFRWLDNSGQLMVESFYWKDGCSYGWLITATPKAVELIRQIIGKETIRINAVIYNYHKQGVKQKPKIIKTKIKW